MPRRHKHKEQEQPVMTPFGLSVPWDTPATSTLMADLREIGLLARGFSEPLPERMWMNQTTYHALRRAMLPRWYRRVWPWLRGRRAVAGMYMGR